jgi:hypothetical protein
MAWWDRLGDPGDQPARPRRGESVYEQRFLDRPGAEDHTQWVRLGEVDMDTGRVSWLRNYRAFNETPLAEWKPRRR